MASEGMKLDLAFYYVGDIKKATEIYSRFLGLPPGRC